MVVSSVSKGPQTGFRVLPYCGRNLEVKRERVGKYSISVEGVEKARAFKPAVEFRGETRKFLEA
jgi:hypothetical protein